MLMRLGYGRLACACMDNAFRFAPAAKSRAHTPNAGTALVL